MGSRVYTHGTKRSVAKEVIRDLGTRSRSSVLRTRHNQLGTKGGYLQTQVQSLSFWCRLVKVLTSPGRDLIHELFSVVLTITDPEPRTLRVPVQGVRPLFLGWYPVSSPTWKIHPPVVFKGPLRGAFTQTFERLPLIPSQDSSPVPNPLVVSTVLSFFVSLLPLPSSLLSSDPLPGPLQVVCRVP